MGFPSPDNPTIDTGRANAGRHSVQYRIGRHLESALIHSELLSSYPRISSPP